MRKVLILTALYFIFFSQISAVIAQNLSVGLCHSLYLCKDGHVMSWGSNCFGRLGRIGPNEYPGEINHNTAFKKVSAGKSHNLYLDSTGYVWSSGSNNYGQTGTGFSGLQLHKVETLDSIKDIAAGKEHSLFLKQNGSVYACGIIRLDPSCYGADNFHFSPILIPNLDSVVEISAGSTHSLFVRANGDVYVLGCLGNGQAGTGLSYDTAFQPIKIDSLSNIRYANAGENNSLFIDNQGQAFFCGDNSKGQAGIGSNTHIFYYPVLVSTLDHVKQVCAGPESMSLFLKNDGTVWITGLNAAIFLNGGSSWHNLIEAAQIPNISGVTEIGLGDSFCLFEIGDSTIIASGTNRDGCLGDGSQPRTDFIYPPVGVTNLCGAPLILPNNTASLDEFFYDKFIIKPNPASIYLDMQISSDFLFEKFSLIDVLGKIVYSGQFLQENITISVENLKRGVYYLKIHGNEFPTQKIIID